MASSLAAAAKPAPSDWKKMKIQELREAMASRGMESAGLDPRGRIVNASTMVESSGVLEVPKPDGLSAQESAGMEERVSDLCGEASAEVGVVPKRKAGSDSADATSETQACARQGENREAHGSYQGVTLTTGTFTDLEKKQQRAERFGVELQVSEQEKRKLRAERFGMQGNGEGIGDRAESEKRRARATRFGLVDDEAKKKARSERFGLDCKQENAMESERRKARAARFGVAVNSPEAKRKLNTECPGDLVSGD